MSITIKEIAEIAGVHRSTVDKVLHKRIGVSDEVRAKVQNIIDEFNYEPNLLGRALKRQQDGIIIGVILLQVDALEQIKKGLEEAYLTYKDFNLKIETFIVKDLNYENQVSIINKLVDKKVNGLVIQPLNNKNVSEAINKAINSGIPVVTANVDIKNSNRMCYVGQDLKKSGKIAANLMEQFLQENNKIAVITNSINNLTLVSIREKAFKKYLLNNNKNIQIIKTIETFEDPKITFNKTMELLKNTEDLQGLYITCGNVKEVCLAVKSLNLEGKIKIISHEEYPEIIDFMKEGVINCTIGGNIVEQGNTSIKILFEYLMYDKKPTSDFISTSIQILVKESL